MKSSINWYKFVAITIVFLTSCYNKSAFSEDAEIPIINTQSGNSESEAKTVSNTDPSRFFNIAVVQILNKTTAKTSLIESKVGDKINFSNLGFIAHKCWQSPLDQKPESKILLEVFETKRDLAEEKEKRIFYGWIFASSPSISGIEHPIYDITAINCKNR